MVIDVHGHSAFFDLYPDYFLDGIIGEIEGSLKQEIGDNFDKTLIKNIVKQSLNDVDAKKIIAQMKEADIHKMVVLMTDLGFERNDQNMLFEDIFDHHVKLKQKYPNEFLMFFGIDPRRESKTQLFEQSITKHGFSGMKLYPPVGHKLDHDNLYEYFEICNSYKIPVLSHTGDSLGDMKNDYDYKNTIPKLAKLFPNINFILAHITFPDFEDNIKLAADNENVYFDLSAFQLDWNDKALLNKKIFKIMELIPYKILFGTDWPIYSMLGTQKKWVDYFRDHESISDSNKQLLLYENACKVLNLRYI